MDIEQALRTINDLEIKLRKIDSALGSLERAGCKDRRIQVSLKSIYFGDVDLILSEQAYADLLRRSKDQYNAEFERLRPIISAANDALKEAGA